MATALGLSLAIGIAACGSSSSSSGARTSNSSLASSAASTKTTTSAGTATSSSSSPAASGGAVSSVTSGPVHGTFSARNHAPVANKPWPYIVKVTDAAGRPLSGTVDIAFAFGGQVVGHDTPPTHPVRDGAWSDTLQFPAAAVGEPLSVQAVVRTSAGSITLVWPIDVVK